MEKDVKTIIKMSNGINNHKNSVIIMKNDTK